MIGEMVERAFGGWFWSEFAPHWNAFFSADGKTADSHRLALGIVVGGFYTALVSKVIGPLVDWAQPK